MFHVFPTPFLAGRHAAAQNTALVPWFASTEYADLAAVADFRNWRFAVTEVLVGSVPGATVAALKVKREATFAEFFAFTATSTTARTYTNVSGVLKNDLAANTPRRDYRNGKQQFRLEDARTNICIRSEEFSNASWTKTAVTGTANQLAAPDGNSTADLITETTATSAHSIVSANTSISTGTAYTASVYAKAGTATVCQLTFASGSHGTGQYANFDLSNGTLGTSSGGTATITDAGSGWYRLTWRATSTGTTSTAPIIINFTNNNTSATRSPSYTGTSQTFYLWGAQSEVGAFPSDYIVTTTASVTRATEVARLSPLLEAILQRTAASVVVRADLTNTVSGDRIFMGGATTVALAKATSTASQITATNATTALNATLGSGTNEGPLGVALGYNASARSLVGNGGTVATDANGPGTLTTVYLADNATSTAGTYGDGLYDFVGIAPEKLSDATLQALAVAAA